MQMSWDQIGLATECITLHRIKIVEEFMGPITSVLSGGATEYKPGKVEKNQKNKKSSQKRKSKEDAMKRESKLLSKLAGAGIEIHGP